MSWSLSATGHCADKDAEAAVIDKLKDAVRDAGATSANLYTQHHGQVNLMVDDTAEQPPVG